MPLFITPVCRTYFLAARTANRREDSEHQSKEMNYHQPEQEGNEPSGEYKEGKMHIPEVPETAPLQALQFIKSELLKTQKTIKDLQSERRLLRKQLSHWTGAVQVLQESQENNHCKVETQIHMLVESNECMKKELTELRHNMQGMIQCCKLKRGSNVKAKRVSSSVRWNAVDPALMDDSVNRKRKDFQSTQFSLQRENDHLKAQNKRTLTHMRRLCESIKTAPCHKEVGRMGSGYCLGSDKVVPDGYDCEVEDATDSQPASDSQVLLVRNEEAELQDMIEKLKNALALQIKPGQIPGIKQELLHAVGQVSRCYTHLINKIIEPTLR
ncbi:dystrotelin isoform X2 [Dendropsophus ebraccatus]|uniref:dystrotelin isoform X2 n=1 Tax=Dendropsophus ebraccatus TaxID=150705 RepID=UPI003831861D